MHKKHIFLRVFSRITIFACVFCTLSAWSDTTTCDIDFTPVTGNSWQNGTPTPTNPVEIESIGTKIGNKYAVQVAVNYDGGVVDLGTLGVFYAPSDSVASYGRFLADVRNKLVGSKYSVFSSEYKTTSGADWTKLQDKEMIGSGDSRHIYIRDDKYTTAEQFKKAMSGVMLYYQRATDETWTAPTLRTVYLDEPLRKVGDYADVLDYKNGTITRNVGVKVLDGTENWTYATSSSYERFILLINNLKNDNSHTIMLSNSYIGYSANAVYSQKPELSCWIEDGKSIRFHNNNISSVNEWNNYLAQQYANGTPVIVYYPLATPVVEQIENWSCTPPITDIQIATTKFVDEEFAAAEAQLATTVQTIESVVSRTIAQTGQIATLQETKQTRPDETCPANMKCLLVQDEDGTPHWYPIIEP